MSHVTSVKLPNEPSDKMKVLNQLLHQARADKKSQSLLVREATTKVTYRIRKAIKERFVKACGSQSQNEVINSLIEKFCRQAEKLATAIPQEAPAPNSDQAIQDIDVNEEPLLDFSQFYTDSE